MRHFFILLFFGFLFFLTPQTALAHVLKSDGSIGAVVHISPDDDPIAGETSSFYFEIKDKEDRFDFQKCSCNVTILQSEKEIFTQSLSGDNSEPGLKNASFTFTFPERGIYQVRILGRANNGEFAPFELNYDIRVERTANPEAFKNPDKKDNWFWAHAVHLAGGFLLGGFLIFALIAQNRKKVAVIILVLFLVGHSLPVKALHASHGSLVKNEYSCCLPVAAVLPPLPEISNTQGYLEPLKLRSSEFISEIDTEIFLIRAPPFF